MKKSKFWLKSTACLLVLAMMVTGCASVDNLKEAAGIIMNRGGSDTPDQGDKDEDGSQMAAADDDADGEAGDDNHDSDYAVTPLERPVLLGQLSSRVDQGVSASVKKYEVGSSLDNITNREQFYIEPGGEAEQLLSRNMFYVMSGYNKEFYETYESNRYALTPNFITVDSMMHTYHLYFSYLMKNTERTYLSDKIRALSKEMVEKSCEQYEALKGTEWESAALRNVAYFAVGLSLSDGSASVPEKAANMATAEITQIMDASQIGESSITGEMLDYSQFKPRGYYEGDPNLESYFRTMMWYGQIGFKQSEEELDRSALLVNLAMKGDSFDKWESIYVVTSFFAGASDDLTYYEYMPAIEAAYGTDVTVQELAGQSDAWNHFHELTSGMPAPKINSIPTSDDHNPDTKATETNKGFRFMGQRFTIDESIFQQLVYENVLENPNGDHRMLPDVLDVAAALGSDKALDILDAQGDTSYQNYSENMEKIRAGIADADDTLWSASLYSNWLYTLKPLLERKSDGYPSFMQTDAWATKAIESFGGSYAELKHDTILYAKQMMAEMGGGDLPQWDDRGYVEPEMEVWSRFAELSAKTAEGLDSYGLLDEQDRTNLQRLEEMADAFLTMSEKELNNELLTDAEYDLIRNYGGNLEHFWKEAYRDEGDNVGPNDFPAAIIADIATDPNGSCLEVGTGNPSNIYVIVPIGDELHICSGVIYSFYQFSQPISNRLTDSSWRQMMGISLSDSGTYDRSSMKDHPSWTSTYRMPEYR